QRREGLTALDHVRSLAEALREPWLVASGRRPEHQRELRGVCLTQTRAVDRDERDRVGARAQTGRGDREAPRRQRPGAGAAREAANAARTATMLAAAHPAHVGELDFDLCHRALTGVFTRAHHGGAEALTAARR